MSGRIRSIKPEVLEDELACTLGDTAWRLWISLWVLADDHGNVRMGDRYLASSVWQDTNKDVSAAVVELIEKGFIEPYGKNAQRYGHIKGWTKHQRIDNAGKNRVPLQEEDDGSWDISQSHTFLPKREVSPRPDDRSNNVAARPPTPTTDPDHRPTITDQPKRKRRTSMKPNWTPSQEFIREYQKQELDVLAMLPEFRNYWIGVGKPMADWEAVLRNRIIVLVEQGRMPRWYPPAKVTATINEPPLVRTPEQEAEQQLAIDQYTNLKARRVDD